MRYAVAYMNYFDNDLKITVVEANDPIIAMIEGARILMDASGDVNEWLNSFELENIPVNRCETRIEEIRRAFFDTDQVISRPLPL